MVLAPPTALLAALVFAQQLGSGVAAPASQIVLESPDEALFKPFNPLDHMSGISPYHDAPGASINPPEGCRISATAWLIRHSSIFANDDDFTDYMEPFTKRMKLARPALGRLDDSSPLAFLRDWESPVDESQVGKITEPGLEDAYRFGQDMRKKHHYGPLLPPKKLGKKEHGDLTKKKGKEPKVPFKVWTASSSRDIASAKAFIRGAFPHYQEGDGGEGDGKYVSLISVANNDTDWAGSLTPHKICPAFTKEAGKPQCREWLETFGPEPLGHLRKLAPEVDWVLEDVMGMMMYCGYESVILKERSSRFCSPRIFSAHSYHNFGYWNDIKYHYQVGYGAETAPFLGMGWVNTSTHNLIAAFSRGDHPHLTKDKLPPPSAPPDSEHTQLVFPYFTHREEPAVALVALGIWNTTEMPSTRMDHSRKWKTSRVLPFLGHVALERLSCDAGEFIRIIVNGAVQKLPAPLNEGPGGSCDMDTFKDYVDERMERYGDFEGACKVKEE